MTPLDQGLWARQIVAYLGCCLLLIAIAAPASADDGLSQAQRNVVAAIPHYWPPQYSLDENNKPTGFAIDVMEEVAKLAGLTVTYLVADNFSEAVELLKEGRADLIPNSGILPERLVTFSFTSPVETFAVSLFVRDDTYDIGGVDDLIGRSLAVVETNISQFMFGKRKDIDVHVFNDIGSAFSDLIAGHVDAFVYPRPVLLNLARQSRIEGKIKTVGPPLKEVKRGIRVMKGNDALLAVLDKAVQSFVGTPEYQRIYAKWYGKPNPYWTVTRVTWLMGGISGAFLLTIVFLRYRFVMRLGQIHKENENRFRDLYDNAPDMYCSVGAQTTKVIQCNKTLATKLGLGKNEIIGRSVFDFYHPDSIEKANECFRSFAATGKAESDELQLKHKDGSKIDVSLRVSAVRDENGKILHSRSVWRDITKHKQMAEALSQSENRLRRAVIDAPIPIMIHAEDGEVLMISQQWTNLTGYTHAEIPTIAEWTEKAYGKGGIIEESRERIGATYDIEEKKGEGEYYITTKSGEARTWDFRSSPLGNLPDGRSLVISMAIDITERKQAEKSKLEAESRFRAVVDASPSAILLKDMDGRYLMANRIWNDWFNPQDREIEGKTVYDFYSKKHADATTAHDREVIVTGKVVTKYLMTPIASGSVISTVLMKFPVLDNNGKITAIGGVRTDITEHKQAEEALRTSEARLSGILDIAPEAVITVGSDMNIQLFNQGAERIFGYKADDVLGRPLDILMPEHFRDGHQKHIQEFKNSGDTYRLISQRQEIIGLRKDGTEFPASASVSKLEIGGKKIFTVMLQDITERKYAQDTMMAAKNEAETATRAKSEFLAAMSHDLRTPLNAILGFADIISHQYFGQIDDKYREYADDIHSSGEHLLALVNEILDLSTIEAGKQSLVKEKLSTLEFITECQRIVEDKARSRGIDLLTKVPKDLPPLYADRRASKQILLNLLSNAIKFTPEGGKVTVSVKASKNYTTLKIADTGKGISPEKLPKLTDPFTRVGGDPFLAEPGWGLGLAITKSLIDLHGGKLDIKSKLGKGTTVTVTFPNGA